MNRGGGGGGGGGTREQSAVESSRVEIRSGDGM